MYLAQRCPCCDSGALDAYPAVVAPFLAERALQRQAERCSLLECRGCGFRFFDLRLEPPEVQRLYADYRGESYLRVRRRHEWWYTRRINQDLGGEGEILRSRQQLIERFLRGHLELTTLRSVIDYGGDRGQVIPPHLGQERVVLDVSGVRPVEGVTAVRTREELGARSFALVMCCQVLEHVSEPQQTLEELRQLGSSESWFYLEVPLERPSLRGVVRGRVGEAYLEALLRVPPLLRLVDFYSTAVRVGLGHAAPLALLKAHEHLNFFHARSLRALMERSGFEVVSCEPQGMDHAFGKVVALSCLARLRSEAPRPAPPAATT